MSASFMQHWVVRFGPLSFHADTILYSLGVSVFLFVLAFLVTRRMKVIPGPLQSLLEMLVEFVEGMVKANMGEKGLIYLPFFATLLLYIFAANTAGLIPGLRSPTADVNVTLGLAAAVMLAMQYMSVRAHGFFGWVAHFFRPNILFFFIHLMELITRPLTLALRLYGNIFAGEVLIAILYMLAPVGVPTLWLALSLMIGAIQAYIFTVLSLAYTGMAVED